MNILKPISKTALWTAAARAVESDKECPMFVDPFARELAGEEGFHLLKKYNGSNILNYIAIRTAFFDRAIAEYPKDQIVSIASGLDTRPQRITCDNITWFEVDHPEIINYKNEILSKFNSISNKNIVRIASDLAKEDWLMKLSSSDFKRDIQTLWIAEGLFFFLTNKESSKLLKDIHTNSAIGSVLLTDFISLTSLRNPVAKKFLNQLETDGNPWLFGTDFPENFLIDNGWEPIAISEPGVSGVFDDRWPFPVYDRSITGIPRNWLIIAQKNWVQSE